MKKFTPCSNKSNFGVIFQKFQLRLQSIRHRYVVRIHKRDKSSLGLIDTTISCCTGFLVNLIL